MSLLSLGCPVIASIGHCALFVRDVVRKRGRSGHSSRSVISAFGKSDDEFERSVSDEVSDCLCRSVTAAAQNCAIFWIGYTIFLASCTLAEYYPMYHTDLQHHSTTLWNFAILIIRLCPQSILGRILPFFYGFLMLMIGCYVFFSDFSSIPRSMAIAALVRTACSMTFGQVCSSFLCNLALATLSVHISMYRAPMPDRETMDLAAIIAFELLMMLFIVTMTRQSRGALTRECSHLVKVRSLSIESSAMTRLLELICDVVVELDSSLRVAEHSPRLSAMLGINRNTQGMELLQHMPHDFDRQRVQRMLYASSENGTTNGEPGAFNATLRDSVSTDIPVEIFYVAFQPASSKGSGHCYIGIREIGDQIQAQLPPSELNPSIEAALVDVQGRPKTAVVHGTAAVAKRQSLSESHGQQIHNIVDEAISTATSSHSSGTSGSQSKWKMVDDRFQITSQRGKRVGILELLMRWNISIPSRSCCEFHAELNDLRSQIKTMLRLPCYPSFHLAGGCQCTECGVVLEAEEEDDFTHCPGAPLRRVRPSCAQSQRSDSMDGIPSATISMSATTITEPPRDVFKSKASVVEL